jgi:hypothetical protein
MKKTFTFSIAILLSLSMYAYNDFSSMTVSGSNNAASLKVIIDGSNYRTNNDNAVLINNLSTGYHAVKIYQVRNEGRNRYFAPNYKLVYSSTIYVRPRYDIDITINRFGKAFYDEQPVSNGNYDNDDHHDNNRNDDHHDNNWNNGNHNGNWNNNDNNNSRAMNAQSFSRFKESLKNEAFENTRMTIARQVIASDFFTTSQIKEVLGSFNFENNKLEVAKYAYKYTIDKREYFTLADCFSFSSNKDELMQYIQNYR